MHAPRIIRFVGLVALGIGLCLARPLPAAAQDGARVEEELRATDEALSRAREIVAESRSPRAHEALERADRVQQSAWQQFHDGRPIIAASLTRDARLLGQRALSLAREDFSYDQTAQRELEKAENALASAREAFDGTPSEHALRLLEEARAQIERARAQLQEGHFEVAIRLAVSAQTLIHQALREVEGASGEILLRELERTDQLIERVRDLLQEGGDSEAPRLLRQAEDLQRSAREAEAGGRPVVAMAATRQAREVANHALDLVQGEVGADAVADAIAETESYLQRAAEVVAESADERAAELLEKAREHQSRAASALDEEQMRGALAETRVARSLAKRAMQLVEGAKGE
jgi:hypothetical protein